MKVEIPVTEVTLLEDRAHVTREGTVKLEAGTTTLKIEGVSPVVVDKTLSAKVPGGEARLGKVRLLRREVILDTDRDTKVAHLEEKARVLQAEVASRKAERDLLESQLTRLAKLANMALAEMTEDAGWDRVEPERWTAHSGTLHEEETGCQQAIHNADLALEKLGETLGDIATQHALLAGPGRERRALIEVEVHTEAATELQLRLTYLVPGACWRPYHTARLIQIAGSDEVAKVHFESDGCVWQNTGEDWNDVQLLFSTERPSLGVDVPLLSTDTLHAHKVGATVAVAAREEKIHTSGLGGGGGKVSPEVPGIDDGGETRKLRAKSPATVPSDGRPYRVPVLAFEGPATTELWLAAEIRPAVLLRSEQTNEAKLPLLAGPVDLIRDSGPVGRTSILYVAPGEVFELGWGPDLALRVHREQRELDEETKLLSSWTTVRHRVVVRVSNIGPEKRTVSVRERLPVSDVEKVKIELEPKETIGDARPDDDGLLSWEISLSPFGRETLELGWKVAHHSDVVGL